MNSQVVEPDITLEMVRRVQAFLAKRYYNTEKGREYNLNKSKRYYEKHREQVNQRNLENYYKNKTARQEYYLANKAKILERQKQAYEAAKKAEVV